jgi:hypothetical protein
VDGLVWRAIVNQVDEAGSESDFVSVADTPRVTLSRHPWSIGGGGAAGLKDLIEGSSSERLGGRVEAMGFFQDTHADDLFVQPSRFFARAEGLQYTRPCVRGDGTRDWSLSFDEAIFFPYDEQIEQWPTVPDASPLHWLWSFRTTLWSRSVFGGQTYREAGRPWWDYHQFPKDRARALHLIAFAEIATHNHFVLDRGGKVFNRTAPVIKLPAGSSEDDHLGLLGLLNSSVACFWLQQVCHNKGRPGAEVAGADERYEMRYAINASNVAELPLCAERPLLTARRLDRLASELDATLPAALMGRQPQPDRLILNSSRDRAASLQRQMYALQDELDWQCYRLYGLLPEGLDTADCESATPPELNLGERAFEIVLARRISAGDESTTWFERHGSTPITELPAHWPADYRAVVERRIALIESDRNIGLIERPEFKRRWNTPAWDDLEKAALRDWLLDRLEQPAFWPASADSPPQLTTTNRLADLARADAAFLQVAALYAGHADFDPARLVAELVAAEAVPMLPVQRYTDDGLRKRAQWEDTWALQRREDVIDTQVVAEEADGWRNEFAAMARTTFGSDTSDEARAWIDQKLAAEIKRYQDERKAAEIGPIPVPPKYKSSDFLKADFWRLRGGLDVPKERFVSFPGTERGADGSLPIAWAGWNHLQLATALAGYYVDMKDTEGWEPARLQPLLAGLLELVPWLEQWHNDLDPLFGERMGTYYKGFVTEEARTLGFTLDDLRSWKPAVVAAKRGRKKANREA